MTWETIVAIIGVLLITSWGIIIPTCISLWKSILKLKQDYQEFMVDNTLTDTERMHLADDIILVIKDATNIFQFFVNLIATIGAVIPKAVGKRAKRNNKNGG